LLIYRQGFKKIIQSFKFGGCQIVNHRAENSMLDAQIPYPIEVKISRIHLKFMYHFQTKLEKCDFLCVSFCFTSGLGVLFTSKLSTIKWYKDSVHVGLSMQYVKVKFSVINSML
jgi:hypothetical protein